jgi:hypothetical protein
MKISSFSKDVGAPYCLSLFYSSLAAIGLFFCVASSASADRLDEHDLIKSADKEISYHTRMVKALSLSNRFLALKHPLSAGNPEYHQAKIAALKKKRALFVEAVTKNSLQTFDDRAS